MTTRHVIKSYAVFRGIIIALPLIGTLRFVEADQPMRTGGRNSDRSVKLGPLRIEAVRIEGGSFDMGNVFKNGDSDEQPVHKVTLSDYYISKTEVTVGQYMEFCRRTNRKMPMQDNGSRDNFPVVYVTWYDAHDFCEWVGGDLPSEAQWEYVARCGGNSIKYPSGNQIDHGDANFSGTGKKDRWKRVAPVAKFPPNMLGVYDLAGNVYEWCRDYYKSDYYSLPAYQDPQGPATSMFKVLRGGSWYHDKEEMRCADRFRFMPVARVSFVGFRVAWSIEDVQKLTGNQ